MSRIKSPQVFQTIDSKSQNTLTQQFSQHTHPIRNARLHRRRDPQRLVNPAEVVVRKVQAERSPQVLPLFAEAIR
jgi:hypothetical protein